MTISRSGTPKAGDPVEDVPAILDGNAHNDADVFPVAAAVVATPTQVRRPWRSTVRTIFQAAVALAAMWAVIVQAAGLPDWAWVGTSLAVAGGITHVMAIPGVETWLRTWLPFLAAAPKPKA